MYISGINYESIVDGIGVRTTIFISGCLHKCLNCQNPQTHSFTYGRELDDNLISEIKTEINKRSFLTGITLSGGDPMYQPYEVIELIKKLKNKSLDIWCYTGFTFEEVMQDKTKRDLLKYIDVLVDGLYMEDLKDITLRFRGSFNQRLVNVKQSLKENKVILWEG